MTIRSQPAGALVYVDDYEIGTTPVSTNFTYYGTRKIRLVKDGYETLTVLQPVSTPWYEVPPLDFFSEHLTPGQVKDQRDFCYPLKPQVMVPSQQLLQRAEGLRSQTRFAGTAVGGPMQGEVLPPGPIAPSQQGPQAPVSPPGMYPAPNPQPGPATPSPILPPGGWSTQRPQ